MRLSRTRYFVQKGNNAVSSTVAISRSTASPNIPIFCIASSIRDLFFGMFDDIFLLIFPLNFFFSWRNQVQGQ